MKPVQRAVGEEEGCILQVLKCRHLILLLHLCPVSPCHLWSSSAGSDETPGWGLAVCVWGRLECHEWGKTVE